MKKLTLLVVLMGGLAGADTKKAPPPDMAAPPPPAKLSRAISDAWGYNRLQASVIESQKRQIEEALAKLAAARAALDLQLKTEFHVDVAAGDAWDEATLEIRRK